MNTDGRTDDLEAFASRVTHDLRGPLAAMRMAADLLDAEHDALSERGRKVLEILRNQTAEAITVVDVYRDVARVLRPVSVEDVDVGEVAAAAAAAAGAALSMASSGSVRVEREGLLLALTSAFRGADEVEVRCEPPSITVSGARDTRVAEALARAHGGLVDVNEDVLEIRLPQS